MRRLNVMNGLKTVFLLTLLSALLLALGYLFAGQAGLVLALVFAGAINIGSYWFSDRLALKMAGAREVTPEQEPRLHAIVEEVASMARLPKPRVYVVENDSPNAFATGRNPRHAAVAATTGILHILDDRELTAVLGHELGHVRNRDILINAVVATVASAIMFVAFMGRWALFFGGFGGRGRTAYGGVVRLMAVLAMIVFAPIAATLIRLAISRQREYAADEAGAGITHMPLALASALEKLETHSRARPMQVNPAVAHLFIVNPLSRTDFSTLFSTHPPIPKRIERLQRMAWRIKTHV
jgi:heat shock protein HtpX